MRLDGFAADLEAARVDDGCVARAIDSRAARGVPAGPTTRPSPGDPMPADDRPPAPARQRRAAAAAGPPDARGKAAMRAHARGRRRPTRRPRGPRAAAGAGDLRHAQARGRAARLHRDALRLRPPGRERAAQRPQRRLLRPALPAADRGRAGGGHHRGERPVRAPAASRRPVRRTCCAVCAPGWTGSCCARGGRERRSCRRCGSSCPRKEDFLKHLCLKAGLPRDAWRDAATEVSTYQVQHFEETVQRSLG